MAEAMTALADPLLILRKAIASNQEPRPTASPDSGAETVVNLAIATHLQFPDSGAQVYALNTPTRFISSEEAVDLRSIYFAWQKKDVAIPDYITSAQQLNDELSAPGGAGGKVRNLVFVERLDLITWLEGASDESEFIKQLETDSTAAQALGSAQIASGAAGGVAAVHAGGIGSKTGKLVNQQLQEIFNNERRMGDRNTVLRGIKPTDFSHVRKHAEDFLGRNRRKAGQVSATSTATAPVHSGSAAIASHPKKPGRRPDPIILLSPSASSLLRMSNIKSFLEAGTYTPPDSGNTATILHTSRLLPTVDPARPLRFILVDTPEQFKPDYWDRVVAVFTTGQTWQFKSYKWQNPPELFNHALGIYVGWRGENIPDSVRGWGKGVKAVSVDKWTQSQGAQGRWRDREIVEGLWSNIEESMRMRGWGKEGGLGGR